MDEESGLCGFLGLNCSQFSPCITPDNVCKEENHICVRHPRCDQRSICYPLSMTQRLCPLTTGSPISSRPEDDIYARATWVRNATTVAGGNGQGAELNQLNYPFGLFVDENQTVYVADSRNNRIVKWARNVTRGQLVAGGNGGGNASNQLNNPNDILVDTNGAMYISDTMNGRVQQWYKNASSGQTLIENIAATGLGQDNQGFLYTADWLTGDLTKYDINGTIRDVLISNLSFPYLLSVDQNQSIYIADTANARVIKVDNGTQNVSVVAGGSPGGNLNQLSWPEGVTVDQFGTVYVADTYNHRVMQWPQGATSGNLIAGGRGGGAQSDQLYYPSALSLDLDGNLYVVDNGNHRVQQFRINKTLC